MVNQFRSIATTEGDEVHSTLVQLHEQRSVRLAHEVLERNFKLYFERANYTEVTPIPLISDRDESVLFTGASISAVKDMLMTGDYPDDKNGVYIAQECLRTNALKYAFNHEWIPYGQIYFKMVTILSRPGRFDEVVGEAIDFTQRQMGIDASRLKIRSTRNFAGLSNVDEIVDIPVEYDTKPEDYYHWEYGIEGVRGEGLTVCVLNPATGKWFDVGNIVKVYGPDGRELGLEFGYGYEFFLTAAVGVDQALKFSKVFELFEFRPGLAQKYYSTIEAVVQMRNAGAELGDNGVDHVYKQYLKSLEFMGESPDLAKSIDDIILEMTKYADFIGSGSLDLRQERRFMLEHKKRKREFAEIVKRVGAYLWAIGKGREPKEFIQDPAQLIEDYLVTHGIREVEVADRLHRLDRFKIFD